jgi:hypothetical protein
MYLYRSPFEQQLADMHEAKRSEARLSEEGYSELVHARHRAPSDDREQDDKGDGLVGYRTA